MYSLLTEVFQACENDAALLCADDWGAHLKTCLSDNYQHLSISCKTKVLLYKLRTLILMA
jgi:hypothetical protein